MTMSFSKLSPVVFASHDTETLVRQSDVASLTDIAEQDEHTKARVLLHGSPGADLHEMVIVHRRGSYIRPHINDGSAKSFTVLNGEMAVPIFSEDGRLESHHRLGDFASGQPFLLRLERAAFHTVVPLSQTVAFIETVKGPHTETRYGDFAPAPDDEGAAETYFRALLEALNVD